MMKAIDLSEGGIYKYPSEYPTMESFIGYINKTDANFIPLERFVDENCAYPYFIEEETEIVYVNIRNLRFIKETNITVYSRETYDYMLKRVMAKVCVNCANYTETEGEDNTKGHSNKINLDGECYFFTEI